MSENNPFFKGDVAEIENEIYSTIKRSAGKCSYVGTYGFYALFSEEGVRIFVTVLVDPAVGSSHKNVVATLKDGKLFQEF